jgi:hypothetical protein
MAVKTEHRFEQRTFAGAVWTFDHQHFTRADIKRQRMRERTSRGREEFKIFRLNK